MAETVIGNCGITKIEDCDPCDLDDLCASCPVFDALEFDDEEDEDEDEGEGAG